MKPSLIKIESLELWLDALDTIYFSKLDTELDAMADYFEKKSN